MFRILGVASYPDAIIWNTDSIVPRNFALAPFKVEDIVGDITPVLSHIFGVIELLVNAAGLIDELSTGGPRGG